MWGLMNNSIGRNREIIEMFEQVNILLQMGTYPHKQNRLPNYA